MVENYDINPNTLSHVLESWNGSLTPVAVYTACLDYEDRMCAGSVSPDRVMVTDFFLFYI